jgi:hypothetical protein
MKKITATTLIVMILMLAVPAAGAYGGTSAATSTTTTLAVNRALAYLKGQQQADGSNTEFDGPLNATSGVALAAAAAGIDANAWTKAGVSGIDFLRSQGDTLSDPLSADANSAKIAMVVMVLAATDNDPYSFAGTDWPALLKSTQNDRTGAYSTSFIRHPWIMMALHAAGETVPQNAVDFLVANREDDGGFGVNGRGSGSDTNTTAICLEALAAAGMPADSTVVSEAVAYLHTQQNDDGGFPWARPSAWGSDSDASSTAWVIQGLIAAGEDPAGAAWIKNSHAPPEYLIGMQNASGAFAYQTSWPDDNLMSTYQAVPALLGKSFPLSYLAPAPSMPVLVSLPDGGQPLNVDEGQTITVNPYVVRIRPSSPFGIAYVEFYIDDVLVGTVFVPDAAGVYSFNWDTSKYHSDLKIVAYDTVGGQTEVRRGTTVVLALPPSPKQTLPYTGR